METNINLNCESINSSPNNNYYTPIQLKLPLVFDEIIDKNDLVYTFVTVLDKVDLRKYFISSRKAKAGRKGYNPVTLLKVILFAFTEKGYASTRQIESLCKNDIRFRWMLQYENDLPTHMTISNFMNKYLKTSIEEIFVDINKVIFELDNVDTKHTYLDGTKMEANANKYSWVWKNACISNRKKLFQKISLLIDQINKNTNNVVIEKRDFYDSKYVKEIFNNYVICEKINTTTFVYGIGKKKTIIQKNYEKFNEYYNKLLEYEKKIDICGSRRNSYSKTDKDATFMRIKTDYMGNDQLLPAYNLQYCICDEYIAALDINQYASDADCFVPLMDIFKKNYGFYPEYPVGDAGYGTYNNYLFCEEHNMKKFLKFPMYKKETTDKKYHLNPFRSINFKKDEKGNLLCPNNKKFIFKQKRPVKNNLYGREEEIYECEDCKDCPLKSKCTKSIGNRIINLNQELTSIHKEVINNLESIQGALLRMNRSIQSEGTFGVMKQDRFYRRIVRKGMNGVKLEVNMISIGFNIYKYHNKKNRVK